MRTPDPPFDGNVPDDGTPSYEWLDEWLCEYVDGTMDPSLEAVFEQYVEANPDLKAHVERLRQTRDLLCGCDLPEEPSSEAQSEVCSDIEGDLLQSASPLSEAVHHRPVATLGIASSVVVALVVGFLAGSMFVEPAALSPTPLSSAGEQDAPTQAVQTAPASDAERDASVQNPVPPRQRDPGPAMQSRDASSSAEPLFFRRTAGPPSPSDSLGGPSVLTTIGAR